MTKLALGLIWFHLAAEPTSFTDKPATPAAVLFSALYPDVAGYPAAGASLPGSFGAKFCAAALACINVQRAVSVVSWVQIDAVALRALWLGSAGALVHAHEVESVNRRVIVCVLHRYIHVPPPQFAVTTVTLGAFRLCS